MNEATLKKAVTKASGFRADFVTAECRTEEDLMALAVAMMQQAEIIFTQLGGARLSAAQFYGAADRMATDAR